MTDTLAAQDALVGVFADLNGLTAVAGPVDNVMPAPAALIVDTEDGEFGDYLVTLDGEIDCSLVITVFTQAANLAAARELLRPYMADGERSVKALVAADPTLGGAVTSAVVTGESNLGRYSMGDSERRYLGVEFPVAVML